MKTISHFRVLPGLCFKTRVGAKPLIWKSYFILMQKLIFTRKVVHPASFSKWGFLELGSDLFSNLVSVESLSWFLAHRDHRTLQFPKTGKKHIVLINREWGHYRCNDRSDEVNTFLLYGLFIMDLSMRSIKANNWPADNFKKHVSSIVVCLSPRHSQVTLVSGYPFWQLSIDHYVDVDYRGYQVKHAL